MLRPNQEHGGPDQIDQLRRSEQSSERSERRDLFRGERNSDVAEEHGGSLETRCARAYHHAGPTPMVRRTRATVGPAIARAFSAPLRRMRSTAASSARSSAYRSRTGAR